MKKNIKLYQEGGEVSYEIPGVVIYPDMNLTMQLRRAYPDRQLRTKIETAIDNGTYGREVDNSSFYTSDIPYRRLLDLHRRAGSPSIHNARHTPTPDFKLKRDHILYDANDYRDNPEQLQHLPIETFLTPDKRYYRGYYGRNFFGDGIYIDYELPPEQLYEQLISEYTHPIMARNLPSYVNVNVTDGNSRDDYDRLEYVTPGANEYYAHGSGLTEDYLKSYLSPERISSEASGVNTRNFIRNYDYSSIQDREERNRVISESDKALNGRWNLEEIATKLDITDLMRVITNDIHENKPSSRFTKFWNEYNRLNPNGGIGGGGEW